MSWGYKILFLYTGFVLLVLFMVFLAYRQDVPLVFDDYYKQELKYQEEIDKLKNARSLPVPISIEYLADDRALRIHFPAGQPGSLTGTIQLMRPSDPKMDTSFPVRADDHMIQRVSLGGMQNGFWKLKVYWENDYKQFLEEKDLIIQ